MDQSKFNQKISLYKPELRKIVVKISPVLKKSIKFRSKMRINQEICKLIKSAKGIDDQVMKSDENSQRNSNASKSSKGRRSQ